MPTKLDIEGAALSIPIDKCREGWLYWITARNASLGVWRREQLGFEISRYKFGSNYQFVEYHWETGPPHGTATPHLAIERVPDEMDEGTFLEYMNEAYDRLDLERFDDLATCLMIYQRGEVPCRSMFTDHEGVDSDDLVAQFVAVTGESPGEERRFADCRFGDEKRKFLLEQAVRQYNDAVRHGILVLPENKMLVNDDKFRVAFKEATGVDVRGGKPDPEGEVT